MDDTQPININITRPNDKEEKYNQFKEYLIINHLDLQRETQNLKNEIVELKIDLREKETEEDKYDARTRYFRSLLTNLNELKKGYHQICIKNTELLDITNQKFDNFYNINKEYYFKLMILHILYMAEHIIFQYLKLTRIQLTIYIALNSTLIYLIVYNYRLLYKYFDIYKNVKDPSIELIKNEIREKDKELKKLDESTLSLENWVYEV